MKKTTNKVLIVLLFLLASCSKQSSNQDYSTSLFYQEYQDLIDNLNADFPGNGIDVFDNQLKDRPMAYGLLMSAEYNRYLHTRNTDAYLLVKKCGLWLMENSDLNNNGIVGFGLPDQWDAFNDNSINEAHHEYTITTAIVVKGLLDWYDIESNINKRAEIKELVLSCLDPYLDNRYDSPIGIPAYSLSPEDTIYDIYNPAAFLLGQLKRYSQITDDKDLKEKLNSKSNNIIKVLEDNVQIDSASNYFWAYGIQRQGPNDLVHALYVIEGIRDFQEYGGTTNLNFSSVHNHLFSFSNDSIFFEHYPKNLWQEERVRLWSIGMLIYSLSVNHDFDEVEQNISSQLSKFYLWPGQYRFKIDDDRVMIRQHAHLILGLSYFIYNNDRISNKN